MSMPSFRCCWMLPLIGFGWLTATPAQANPVTCTGSITALVFDTVNPQSSLTTANATIHYTCTDNSSSDHYLAMCFGIGPDVDPRLMQAGANHSLQFQIYAEPSYSHPVALGTPLYVPVLVPKDSSTSGTATLYGKVLAGQTTAVPGTYTATLSNNTLDVVHGNNNQHPANCNGGGKGDSFSAFTVSAPVANQCTVSASTLNFGPVGVLSAAQPGTSTISVQCPTGTSYNVGLDAGLNGGGNINARKMVLGANTVSYQLYSNAGHTAIWGSTIGTNTATGSGNGNSQDILVYGSVPAQTTPAAGVYTDTVTVTVTY